MPTLDDLAAKLATSHEWDEEQSIIDAVANEIATNPPSCLLRATGEWKEPYLYLELRHRDGTVIRATQGDGYTAVVGDGVNYQGHLDAASIIDVIVGSIRGQVVYVVHTRLGRVVAAYFQVVGREAARLGYAKGIAGFLPSLLRAIPRLPESVSRRRISFDSTPAVLVVP